MYESYTERTRYIPRIVTEEWMDTYAHHNAHATKYYGGSITDTTNDLQDHYNCHALDDAPYVVRWWPDGNNKIVDNDVLVRNTTVLKGGKITCKQHLENLPEFSIIASERHGGDAYIKTTSIAMSTYCKKYRNEPLWMQLDARYGDVKPLTNEDILDAAKYCPITVKSVGHFSSDMREYVSRYVTARWLRIRGRNDILTLKEVRVAPLYAHSEKKHGVLNDHGEWVTERSSYLSTSDLASLTDEDEQSGRVYRVDYWPHAAIVEPPAPIKLYSLE